MKFLRLFFLLVIILALNELAAANKSGRSQPVWYRDTIIKLDPVKDRKLLRGNKNSKIDTIVKDTTKKDTVAKNPGELSEIITTKADDSTVYDKEHQLAYLYGNARVTYGDFELDADYIRVDEKTHLVFASGRVDPKTHQYKGRPISKMGKDDKPMTADSLYFDYKTKKAHVFNGSTEQDGNYVSGGQIKKLNDSEFAYHNVLYSTCDKPYPYTDFGIVITKGIAEKKRIISGPAYMEIEGVPLPFVIPFGFFPKPDTRTSGFILPSFGEDAKLGFYLRNMGYYFGINDYVDATTQATIFSKGAFESTNTVRYIKKYKYQGGLTFGYGSHNYGLEGDPATKDFNIQWQHSQDANAHPGTNFSASVNAGTSTYYSNNAATNGYTAAVSNNLHSSIAYSKTWEGTPFNFTATMTHSQDLARKTLTLDLPTFGFNMATISPFDSKDRVGAQKWYQRITVGYSLQGTNRISNLPESELFTKETFTKRLQTGFQHQIPVGFNLNVLKFFQFNTSVNYNERWYLQTTRQHYARGSLSGADSVILDTVPGFRRVGDYSMSAGFSTKVYGIMQFKKGRLKAIRDVITPSLSFSYRPDYSSLAYSYNQVAVSNATIPYQASYRRYSIYDNNVYGGPSGGRQAGLALSVDNTIEAKVKPSATDTSTQDKKVPIIQGLSASTFYNFAADSFKLTNISLAGHTAFFNQKVNVSFSGTLDPYVTKVFDTIQNNQIQRVRRVFDRYTFQDGKLPFLTNFTLTMGGSLNSTSFHPTNPNTNTAVPAGTNVQNMTASQADRLARLNSDPSAYVDFNVPWNLSLSYSFNYANDHLLTTTSNTLQLNGDFNLTPKWKIQYSTNYDIKANQFTMTSFNIYRDLHCWDLSFMWVPFGYYRSYNVTLKVKATILQDLKLSKRKDYYNNF